MPEIKTYVGVWLGLIAGTIMEVVLRSLSGEASQIVPIIGLIASAQAIAISLYYQHLRYDGMKLAALPIAAVAGVVFLAISAVIVGMNMM
jgi:cell shape-determining protein MreD